MSYKPKYGYINSSLKDIIERLDADGVFHSPQGCVFVTAGNSLRSDDGAGPYIGKKLDAFIKKRQRDKQKTQQKVQQSTQQNTLPCKQIIQQNICLINAGIAPENHIGPIIRLSPGYVVFIDAADFNGKPGEMILLDDDSGLPDNSLSTHTIPLNLISAMIKSECPIALYYIGIQAENLEYGEKISLPVQRAADLLAGEIALRI